MKKHFTPKPKDDGGFGILTSPYFVISLVIICFAILTPKIFLPIFMQIFGLSSNEPKPVYGGDSRFRAHGMPPNADPRTGPQFGRPGPGPQYGQPQAPAPAGKGSLLTYLLPIYAIGIGIYMIYTLFKVFKKDDPKEENDSDFDDIDRKNYKFKESMNLVDEVLNDSSSKYGHRSNSEFQRSEESEDELNEYARYDSVDPEYLEYLKEMRRQKKAADKKVLLSKKAAKVEGDEIALTPGSGMTSITNTNVLMNDTLERMKHSLNKINNQLVEVEKKGHPLEDPELDSLKLQLTQTELQMSKIMTIVNSVSATLDENKDSEEDTDDYDFDEIVENRRLKAKNMVDAGFQRNNKVNRKNPSEQTVKYLPRESFSSSEEENKAAKSNKNKKQPEEASQESASNKPVSKNYQKNLKKKLRKKAKKNEL